MIHFSIILPPMLESYASCRLFTKLKFTESGKPDISNQTLCGPRKKYPLIRMALYFQTYDQCSKGFQIAFQSTKINLL